MNKTDFSKITPCGGGCDACDYKENGQCKGCREAEGKCVKLWSDGCEIYKCCNEHNVYFCGVCGEFPCEWIINKIAEWDKDGIERLTKLRNEYLEMYQCE